MKKIDYNIVRAFTVLGIILLIIGFAFGVLYTAGSAKNNYNFINFNDGEVFLNPANISHMTPGIMNTCHIRMINETKYESLEVGGTCEDIIQAIYELE